MNKLFHLTKEGVAELKTELKTLVGQRAAIAERIKTAREFGDLGENMEYTAARQDQERNEARISEIEGILANAQLISSKKGSGGKVVLGSSIKLKSDDGKAKQFQVVGTVEADPLNGKISDESPIGKALMGKKEGDEVVITTPVETATYKIIAIA
ncbi:MAG TPA: transcription elongation factor GreA [Candidatus Saccharimonadales bacterium]|nr:transcription elongation factor GreA [Candidatus Saccharimonadales bacterium]